MRRGPGAELPAAGRARSRCGVPPRRVRTDHALESGVEISPYYDSMIAKVIAHGATRDEARERLARALDDTVALGVPTNKAFLAAVLRDEEFATHGATTDFLAPPLRRRSNPPQPDAATLAIAAALLAADAGYGEWNSWSNNPARAMRVEFGETDVALRHFDDAYRAQVGDTEIVLRILSIDPPHARVAHRRRRGDRHLRDRAARPFISPATAKATASKTPSTPPAQRAAAASDGRLVAPMNGRVVAVNAKAGDTVEAGPRARRARSDEDGACAERAARRRASRRCTWRPARRSRPASCWSSWSRA